MATQIQQPTNEWPVIDASGDEQRRRRTAPKRHYRLLAGTHVVQTQVGVDPKGEPVLQDKVYRRGDIIESTDDLCKMYNGGNRVLSHRKFDLVPDGEPEFAAVPTGPTFTWNPKEETIEQFLARTKAEAEAA